MGRVESAVAFSGRIKSGKTTLARRVATELSLPFVSFGDFVRAEAESRGLDGTDRTILQGIGQEFVDAGLSKFCTKVLDAAAWKSGSPLVVDGVRHVDVLQELRRLLNPTPLRLVYVNVADAIHANRFSSTDTTNCREAIENHATESDVISKLMAVADIVVNAESSIDDTVEVVLEFLQQLSILPAPVGEIATGLSP